MPVSTKAGLLVLTSGVMVWTFGSPQVGGGWSSDVGQFLGALVRYLTLAV